MSKWHSVDEKLPKEYRKVLVYCRSGLIFTAYLNDDLWYQEVAVYGAQDYLMYDDFEVTHWKKLGKGPVEDSLLD